MDTRRASDTVQRFNILPLTSRSQLHLAQHVLVPKQLHVRQAHKQLDLLLRRQVRLHVRLEATQQKRPENLLLIPSCGSHGVEAFHQIALNGSLEVGVKHVGGAEHVGHQKVQQSPQFMQVVLEWRSRHQQSILGAQLSHDDAERALLILDAVCFIDDEVGPLHSTQRRLLSQHHLVARDQHMERHRLDILLDYLRTGFLIALQYDHAQARTPLRELAAPIGQGGLWNNDNVRT